MLLCIVWQQRYILTCELVSIQKNMPTAFLLAKYDLHGYYNMASPLRRVEIPADVTPSNRFKPVCMNNQDFLPLLIC